jgi:hypothetical protein
VSFNGSVASWSVYWVTGDLGTTLGTATVGYEAGETKGTGMSFL